MKGCRDVAKLTGIDFSCCNSCHDDEDEGYVDMIEREYRGVEYHICCAASIALDKFIKAADSESLV